MNLRGAPALISRATRGSGRSWRLSTRRRDQRAVLLLATGCRSALSPSRPRLFHSTNRALVTSAHPHNAATATCFRLRLGGGTFHSGSDSLCSALRPPLHFPRSPSPDRSYKPICHERQGGVPLAAQQVVCAGQVLRRACCPGFPNAVAKAIRMGNPVTLGPLTVAGRRQGNGAESPRGSTCVNRLT